MPSLTQTTRAYKSLTKDQERFWKRILIIDDDADLTTTFKAAIEDGNNGYDVNKRIEVYTSNDPVIVSSDFKPNYYDLLLVDINMPHMNGFELCEKIFAIDTSLSDVFWRNKLGSTKGNVSNKAGRMFYQKASCHGLFA
jgi:response regulator RpfG family c-di-GMP phosphodiesterase